MDWIVWEMVSNTVKESLSLLSLATFFMHSNEEEAVVCIMKA